MKIYLDTAFVHEIEKRASTGLIEGVTTNPSLMAQQGQNPFEVVQEICRFISGPVSVQIIGESEAEILKKAERFLNISSQIMIKVHLSKEGLKACRTLRRQGVMVNVTLCFSVSQALLAAKAGATCVSPFLGRLEDAGFNGLQILEEMCHLYALSGFDTEILAASLRSVAHVESVCGLGVDIITLPVKVFDQMYHHPLTDAGYQKFVEDFKE